VVKIRGSYLLFTGSHTSIWRADTTLLTAALGATAILGATAFTCMGAWAALTLAQATGAAAEMEHTACILKDVECLGRCERDWDKGESGGWRGICGGH